MFRLLPSFFAYIDVMCEINFEASRRAVTHNPAENREPNKQGKLQTRLY